MIEFAAWLSAKHSKNNRRINELNPQFLCDLHNGQAVIENDYVNKLLLNAPTEDLWEIYNNFLEI